MLSWPEGRYYRPNTVWVSGREWLSYVLLQVFLVDVDSFFSWNCFRCSRRLRNDLYCVVHVFTNFHSWYWLGVSRMFVMEICLGCGGMGMGLRWGMCMILRRQLTEWISTSKVQRWWMMTSFLVPGAEKWPSLILGCSSAPRSPWLA